MQNIKETDKSRLRPTEAAYNLEPPLSVDAIDEFLREESIPKEMKKYLEEIKEVTLESKKFENDKLRLDEIIQREEGYQNTKFKAFADSIKFLLMISCASAALMWFFVGHLAKSGSEGLTYMLYLSVFLFMMTTLFVLLCLLFSKLTKDTVVASGNKLFLNIHKQRLFVRFLFWVAYGACFLAAACALVAFLYY